MLLTVTHWYTPFMIIQLIVKMTLKNVHIIFMIIQLIVKMTLKILHKIFMIIQFLLNTIMGINSLMAFHTNFHDAQFMLNTILGINSLITSHTIFHDVVTYISSIRIYSIRETNFGWSWNQQMMVISSTVNSGSLRETYESPLQICHVGYLLNPPFPTQRPAIYIFINNPHSNRHIRK